MTLKESGFVVRALGEGARLAAAGLLVLLVQGCAGPGGASNKASQESPSASDPSEVDRRARVHLELAGAYFSRNQANTALDEVKLALQSKPDLPDAYNLRGLIYASMGEVGLAEDNFRRALQMAPRDADTMHNYGWFLCQQRRYDDASAQFRAALEVPNYRDVTRTWLAMGVCQARNNRLAEAEQSLMRSFELDPANPTTSLNLAEVLLRRGELERARFYIRRVNGNDALVSAQTLWLAARIERKLGQSAQVVQLGNDLQNRFPNSPEALLYEKGRFDD
ncbi:MAG: type IV pilus biogenesis/stability protein PilW [Burkholderiaceae bacterium]